MLQLHADDAATVRTVRCHERTRVMLKNHRKVLISESAENSIDYCSHVEGSLRCGSPPATAREPSANDGGSGSTTNSSKRDTARMVVVIRDSSKLTRVTAIVRDAAMLDTMSDEVCNELN